MTPPVNIIGRKTVVRANKYHYRYLASITPLPEAERWTDDPAKAIHWDGYDAAFACVRAASCSSEVQLLICPCPACTTGAATTKKGGL